MTSRFNIKKRLPSLPSALLETALNDLKFVERDKSYEVNMGDWHRPKTYYVNRNVCAVCLAGATMAVSLKAPSNTYIAPELLPKHLENKMYALDSFRCGDVEEGLWFLSTRIPTGMKGMRKIIPYASSPEKFKAGIRRLIRDLRKHNL